MKQFFNSLPKSLAVYGFLNLLYSGTTFASELRIRSGQDLINFAKAVNAGTTYSGYTVLLDGDIEFNSTLSQQFVPIGKDTSNNFVGTFDGQGHVISNLVISSSLQNTGLFGYSNGMTIKNTILDSSCSITSTFTGNFVFVSIGSFIGLCLGSNTPCNVESTVNMGKVSFSGNTKNDKSLCGPTESTVPTS